MKYTFVFLLFLAAAISPLQPTSAQSDATSLALLVKTLNSTDNPEVRTILMRGMLSGLAGRRNVDPPEGWKELSKKLKASQHAEESEIFQQLSQIFGDSEATERALAILEDTTADAGARRTSLRSLLSQQNKQVSAKLESLLDDPTIRLDAIRGYAAIENASAPKILLERYGKMDDSVRRAVIETLATRKGYATALLNAIDTGKVDRKDIPAHVARSLDVLLGEQFIKVFGEVQDLSADRAKLMAKYKAMCSKECLISLRNGGHPRA